MPRPRENKLDDQSGVSAATIAEAQALRAMSREQAYDALVERYSAALIRDFASEVASETSAAKNAILAALSEAALTREQFSDGEGVPARLQRLVIKHVAALPYYQQHMRRVAARFLGDSYDVDDVVQLSTCKAIQYADTYTGTRLKPWLGQIAARTALDVLRTRRSRLQFESNMPGESDGDATQLEKPAAKLVAPHEIALKEELIAFVRNAMSQIPQQFREALHHWSEGLSYEEMAALLGCSTDRVTYLIRRGKELVEERLRPLLDDPDC